MTAPAGLEACEFVATKPIFDVHQEYDREGKKVREFSRDRLQRACDYANGRAKRNHYGAFGPGHTQRGVKEQDQADVWGFHANHRLGTLPDGKTDAIFVDVYAKPGLVKNDNGDKVPVKEAIKDYPYVSVEYWDEDADGKVFDGFVDRVAILKQTPKRDMGIQYAKGAAPAIIFADPACTRPLAAQKVGRVLCYSMESPMLPSEDASAAKPGSADVDSIIEQLKTRFPKLAALMIEEPPAPAAADPLGAPPMDAPPPPPSGGSDPLKFNKGAENEAAFFKRELEAANARIAAIENAEKAKAAQYSKANAEERVTRLQRFEGVKLDFDREVQHFAKLPMEGGAREAHEKYIVEHYQRLSQGASAPRGGMFPTAQPPQGSSHYSKDEVSKAVEMATSTGKSYEECLKAVKA